MKNQKLLFLGGDLRIVAAADCFSADQYECLEYALPNRENSYVSTVSDLPLALQQVDTIIAPVPFSKDGESLYSPFSSKKIDLDWLFSHIPPHVPLYAGSIRDEQRKKAEKYGLSPIDYNLWEDFSSKNAELTAKITVDLIENTEGRKSTGRNCAILGAGRIARYLLPLLKIQGIRVCFYARRELELDGMPSLPLSLYEKPIECYDLIVNTIPFPYSSLIEQIGAGHGLLVDLAGVYTNPVGNLRLLQAPALPGRIRPTEAGQILHDCLKERLFKGR